MCRHTDVRKSTLEIYVVVIKWEIQRPAMGTEISQRATGTTQGVVGAEDGSVEGQKAAYCQLLNGMRGPRWKDLPLR
jgi:hypothetical protein